MCFLSLYPKSEDIGNERYANAYKAWCYLILRKLHIYTYIHMQHNVKLILKVSSFKLAIVLPFYRSKMLMHSKGQA